MTRLSIEAFEDLAHPGSGHAVVLLRGLDNVPEPPLFRLRIIDPAPAGATAPRLSAGNLEPTCIRATPDGIELIVGPDITACPYLLPGTAVEFELPGLRARGGFLWPSMTPAVTARRRRTLTRQQPGAPAKAGPAPERAGDDLPSLSTPATTLTSPSGCWQALDQPSRKLVIPAQGAVAQLKGGVGRSYLNFLAAVTAGVLAVEAALIAWRGDYMPVTLAMPKATAVHTGETLDPSAFLFQDWLRAGSRSPRGVPVAGVSASQALERANQHLIAGPAGRDTNEGIFWLKHYLSATAGDTITTRAITQLGSAYAEPSAGPPDYERARHLWLVSAAIGDPLAMCFLAALFNRGLGVPADSAIAGNWRERARRAGGCGDSMGFGGLHEP